ncbi:MAG: ChaN family lipoprotein [Candidatus Micrarchaeota archaeon]
MVQHPHDAAPRESHPTAFLPPDTDSRQLPARFFVDAARKMVPIDYASWTRGHNLFLVGERHCSDIQRQEMTTILRESRPTVLALECLPSSAQSYIDGFLSGANDGSRIQTYLQARMGENAQSYLNLILYARDNGISVIGLEAPSRGTLDNYNPAPTLDSDFTARNEHWATVIRDYQGQHPDARIAVFAGGSHIYALNSLLSPSCPPIDISQLSSTPLQRKFPPPPLPDSGSWELMASWQKIQAGQERFGWNNTAIRVDGAITVIRGAIE